MTPFIRSCLYAAVALAGAWTFEAEAARGTPSSSGAELSVKSAAALVIDLATDQVLFDKGADDVRPIASISKLFGSLVLMEECKLDPDALHVMSVSNREAARGGDKTKLTTGWGYTHRDLLHAALMRSDNRALPALAEDCGLDPAAFAAKMTAKARSLGLVKTNFKEPDGLSIENVSTAREVMVALRASIKIPALTEIMGKSEYVITAHKGDRTREIKIHNTDRMLGRNIAQILGGKTGYTDPARYCLAIAARTMEGREVGMVFLGAEGRFTRFADFTRVVHWLAANTPAAGTAVATDKAAGAPPAAAAASAIVGSVGRAAAGSVAGAANAAPAAATTPGWGSPAATTAAPAGAAVNSGASVPSGTTTSSPGAAGAGTAQPAGTAPTPAADPTKGQAW